MLSPAKLAKVEVQARSLLRYASLHKRFVRVHDIRSFAGLGNSVSPAVVDARLRPRELFNCIKLDPKCVTCQHMKIAQKFSANPRMTHVTSYVICHMCHGHAQSCQSEGSKSWAQLRHFTGSRSPSHAAIRDLQWWARLSSNEHIGRDIWSRTDAIVFIDATMSGWGAAWNVLVPLWGFFDSRHEGAHID